MKRNINFDILESLRGLASLYVCIGHSRAILWIGGEHYLKLHPRETLGFSDYLVLGLNMITRLSSEFVIVFFVLSGFSIAHSLRKNKESLPFYKRRFIRLYPPYLAAVFWAMLVIAFIGAVFPYFVDGTYRTPAFDRMAASRQLFSWSVFFQNLIYLPQLDGLLSPFWSLTIEVIFYLLAPFVLRNKKAYYALSLVLFVVVAAAKNYLWHLYPLMSQFFFCNLFFAAGVLFYHSFDTVVQRASFFTTSKTLWTSVGLFIAMIGISLLKYSTLNALLAACMSMMLIIYLLSKNLQIKWLIDIGRFSYTLYITHYSSIFLYLTLYYLITKAVPPYIYVSGVFIPCIFFCLGIAYLQYYFIERRSKQVLDHLRKKELKRKDENAYTASPSANKAEKTNW